MFVRVTWIDGVPGSWEAPTDLRQSIAQDLQSQPGWLATALLADRQTGSGVSVGYWENEQTLRASEPGHAARMQRGQAMGTRVRDTERYEIVLQERSAPLAWFPTLAKLPRAVLEQCELVAENTVIHWDDPVDEWLPVASLLGQPV